MTTQTMNSKSKSAAVFDVNEADFQQNVIERSRQTPVVVDFWAPWCGPCRTLGPTLEKLAQESKGAWMLAKLNVDNNQRLSQMFRVQGIPAVKAFLNGKLADEFTGALPESQVRTWLKRFLPAPSNSLLEAAAALEQRDPQEAIARLRVAVGDNPDDEDAQLALGRLLVQQGEAEGIETLRQIQPGSPTYSKAQAWIALADMFAPGNGIEDSGDLAARFKQAADAVRKRDYANAIEHLLAIVARDRAFRDDAARKTLLAVFEVLGNEDPLVLSGRRKLANLLF